MEILEQPLLWVAVSFGIFVGCAYKYAGPVMAKMLDDRAAKIKNELGEALRLKEEAQALLASYQRKQKEVAEEAQHLLKEAEAEAKRISLEAEKELDLMLNKRIELAMQKIANYENSIIQQVKNNAVDIAISAVRALVIENMKNDTAEALVGNAISSMGKKLH